MKTKEIPTNIGEYLKYDETSPSCLRWIKRTGKRNHIGDIAGCVDSEGYYITGIFSKVWLNHRIIFFLHNGYCPTVIDHRDGDNSNNKIGNLREATASQNGFNAKIPKNNTSGYKGITKKIQGNCTYWYINITKNKKTYTKYFPINQFQEACDYADALRKKLHGDFANVGGVK